MIVITIVFVSSIINAAPGQAIEDSEDDSPWYIFGYGSLLSSSSRIRTECGLRGVREDFIEWATKNLNVDVVFNKEKGDCIRENQAKQFIPAQISGYRRGWYAAPEINGLPQNDLFIAPTYLGLIKDSDYNTTGLLYSVTKDQLNVTDDRERDYLFETLTKKDLTLYGDKDIPDHAKIRVYASPAYPFDLPTKEFPIVQSYLDVFLGGTIEIEEDNPEIETFALNTCKQTYGWVGGWVNDRPYPKYRAKLSSLRAEKIDALLFKCMEENKADMILQESSLKQQPELKPLTSAAIGSITFSD